MTLWVAAVLATLAVASTFAQQSATLPQPRKIDIVYLQDIRSPDVPDPPERPAGANAWSLRINTTGGFTGMGVGSVTISSDGRMACGPAPCASPIAAQMNPISTAIGTIAEAAWVRRAPSGFCRDCVHTTVVLKRREGDVVRTYVASWDDSQPITPQLRELRRLALELRTARSTR